jgi:hypothetical protein
LISIIEDEKNREKEREREREEDEEMKKCCRRLQVETVIAVVL